MSAGAPVPARAAAAGRRVLPERRAAHPVRDDRGAAGHRHLACPRSSRPGPGNGVCVGRPRPGVEVRLSPLDRLGRADGELTAEPGVTGEICVAAAHVKQRYDRLWATEQASSAQPGLAPDRRRRSPRHSRPAVGRGPAGARDQRARRAGHPGRGRAGRSRAATRWRWPPWSASGPPGPSRWWPWWSRRPGRGRPGRWPRRPWRPAVRAAAAPIPLAAVLDQSGGCPPTSGTLQDRPGRRGPLGRSGAGRPAAGPAVKVLVTGASGMLGAATARALAARGDRVTVLQRRPAGLGLPEVLADVADAERGPAAQWPARTPWCTWPPRSTSPDRGRSTRAPTSPAPGPWSPACRAAGRRPAGARVLALGRPRRRTRWSGSAPARPTRRRARGAYARSKAVAEQIALAADGAGPGA